jgi:hypothetical protein
MVLTVRWRFVAAVSVIAVMALACGVNASSLPAVTPEEEEDWLSSCRHAGFDPFQLACSTCHMLLPPSSSSPPSSSLSDACLRCCQPYKDVERIRKPYEAAVLLIHHHKSGGSGGGGNKGEFDQFLDEDFDQIVQAKGEQRLGKLLDPHLDRFPTLLSNGGGFYFHLPVATLLFFDSMDAVDKHQQHGRKDKGDDALLEAAREVIKLDGWKRDDIRDMLTALLP